MNTSLHDSVVAAAAEPKALDAVRPLKNGISRGPMFGGRFSLYWSQLAKPHGFEYAYLNPWESSTRSQQIGVTNPALGLVKLLCSKQHCFTPVPKPVLQLSGIFASFEAGFQP